MTLGSEIIIVTYDDLKEAAKRKLTLDEFFKLKP